MKGSVQDGQGGQSGQSEALIVECEEGHVCAALMLCAKTA